MHNPTNHPDGQQPFFEWGINAEEDNRQIVHDKIIADIGNPFFKTRPRKTGGPIVYRGWTCVPVDLTGEIGNSVCISFQNTDCAWGRHFGYAYIDGICSDPSLFAPIAEVNTNEIYCDQQLIPINADGSKFYNRYSWEICHFIDGSNQNCVNTPVEISYNIPPIEDVIQLYNSLSALGVAEPECGSDLEITLNVFNDCGEASVAKTVQYVCDQSSLDYQDLLICARGEDVKMVGEIDCNGCTYVWEPSIYLDDNTSSLPTIMGSLNYLAYDQTYTVTATNSAGCEYVENVAVYDLDDLGDIVGEISIYRDNGPCKFQVYADVEFEEPVSTEDFQVEFYYYTSNGMSDRVAGVLVGDPGTRTTFTFVIDGIDFDKRSDVGITAYLIPGQLILEGDNDLFIYGNCTMSSQRFFEHNRTFVLDIDVYVAEAFTPNNDGINDVFRPFFPNNSNVAEAHFEIYTRWGSKVWESHAIADPDGPGLSGEELAWDGTFNGQLMNPAVFSYKLAFRNCTEEPTCLFPLEVWQVDPLPTSCNDNFDCDEDHIYCLPDHGDECRDNCGGFQLVL